MIKEKRRVYTIIYWTIALILGFIMIYPLLWMLAASFKENSEIYVNTYSLIPKTWAIADNYSGGWKGIAGVPFWKFIWNTFLVAVIGTAGGVCSSLLAAYAFARIQFRLKKFWFTCVLITMMIPAQVLIVPQYIIFRKVGLINTMAALITPWFFGGAFFIFLMIQFFRGIPKELDEAAEIDGCNKIQTLLYVLLPAVSPAIVTSAIFSFYWIWQDFFSALIFLTDPRKYTVSMGLKLFIDPSSPTNSGQLFAMSTLSLFPVIFFFIIFQKYLVEGVVTSGLKG